jgi:hypothetical protein
MEALISPENILASLSYLELDVPTQNAPTPDFKPATVGISNKYKIRQAISQSASDLDLLFAFMDHKLNVGVYLQ